MKRTSFILAGALCLAGAAIGCIDAYDDDDLEVPPGPENLSAALRVIHLSPGAAEVDVWLNGTGPAYSQIGYAEGTPYLEMAAGIYDLEVTAAGGAPGGGLASLVGLPLFATSDHTAVIYGAPDTLETLAIEEDRSPVAPDVLRLRVVHVAAGASDVDVVGLDAEAPDTTLLADDVAYGEAAEAFELPVSSAGPATIGLDLDDDQLPEERFVLAGLAPGSHANLFVVADGAGELRVVSQLAGGEVVALEREMVVEPPAARVRAINLSPTAPALDVGVAGPTGPIATDLELGKSSPYLSLEPGAYELSLSKSSDPETTVFEIGAVDLLPGARYTVAAFGYFDDLDGMVILDEPEAVEPGSFVVRAIHTAPTLGQIDLWDFTDQGNPTLLDQNINFGETGQPVSLPAGQSRVMALDANADDAPDAIFELPDLPEGEVANLFATSLGPDTVALFTQLDSGEVLQIADLEKLP